ncbi:MAG: NAD(P)H-binding protein [Fibrobacter sp.]|nr:NAD(P)H-binding protein [Fibrobacter sp.]
MKVALLGSTGLVGKNVLKLLARLDQLQRIYCPVRTVPQFSELGISEGSSKVDFEQINFESHEKLRAGFLGCDAVICCLGTTRKKAGSKAAQEKIDLRLPLSLAAIAKKEGVKHFLCVSAQGANSASPFFYNRLKGMLEEGLTMMGFESLTLVRPSLLLGKHKEPRFGEDLMQKVFGRHPEFLPSFFRPVHAETVAAHLVASLLKPPKDRVGPDGVKGRRIIYNRVLAKTKVDELF